MAKKRKKGGVVRVVKKKRAAKASGVELLQNAIRQLRSRVTAVERRVEELEGVIGTRLDPPPEGEETPEPAEQPAEEPETPEVEPEEEEQPAGATQ